MLQGAIIWIFTLVLSYLIVGNLGQRYTFFDRRFAMALFFYHTALAFTYYLYALSNPSDSKSYFSKALFKIYGDNWFDYFGTSTRFLDFISFSLVNHLGFTYESCMVVFAWLGFLGFLYFYIFFRERLVSNVTVFGYSAVTVLFLLPNLHFWSASLGKGAITFFGLGLFFFGMNKPGVRWWALILGSLIIFQIRPHIYFVVLIAIALSYTFSSKGVGTGYRIAILIAAGFLLFFIYDDILKFTGLEDESMFDPFISHRATELTKATSGIDITSYSIPEKLFAFWFRPLFFDAPGILGIIVSFENLFYLFFFGQLIRKGALRYLLASDAIVKTCLLTFLGISFALAQISGNLGLAMRQKSQVMLLMLFVIVRFLDEKKVARVKKAWRRAHLHAQLSKKEEGQ